MYKRQAYEIVVANTQAMANQIEEVEVVKKDLYTPYIDRAEEQVAEMTYAKAFELYGNPLPDIIDLRIEKELSSILGNGFAVIYLASQMLVNRSNERGYLSLIHISEPTRLGMISYAVFCLKKKKKKTRQTQNLRRKHFRRRRGLS